MADQLRMSVCIYIGFTKSSQDGIGTAASVVTLIGSTVTLIQQVRNAWDRVKGASKTLDSLSKQLDSLHRSLSLVRDEKALQTAAVEQQVQGIAGVAEELRFSLDARAAEQQRPPIS